MSGAAPARVVAGAHELVWRPRWRAPALQRLLTGVVELATELLLAVAVWAWWHGLGGTLAEWVLPLWVLVSMSMMGLAVGWDADGRVRVRRVAVTSLEIRLGSTQRLPRGELRRVVATGGGWGPLHRASLRIEHAEGAVELAADGDTMASLESLAGLLQPREHARPRVP